MEEQEVHVKERDRDEDEDEKEFGGQQIPPLVGLGDPPLADTVRNDVVVLWRHEVRPPLIFWPWRGRWRAGRGRGTGHLLRCRRGVGFRREFFDRRSGSRRSELWHRTFLAGANYRATVRAE